jgi:hypothetical protein
MAVGVEGIDWIARSGQSNGPRQDFDLACEKTFDDGIERRIGDDLGKWHAGIFQNQLS